MTARLEKVLRELSPEEIEKVSDFAEFLASRQPVSLEQARLLLDWAGAAASLKDRYASGVDAAHDALNIMAESAERNLHR